MTDNSRNQAGPLDQDTQNAFADMRALLRESGDEPNGPGSDDTIVIDSTVEAATVETMAFESPGVGDGEATNAEAPAASPTDWRTAEASPASPTAEWRAQPMPPQKPTAWAAGPYPGAGAPYPTAQNLPPQNPAPQQAWVAGTEPHPTTRVGLLVWSGVLIILSLLIVSNLLIPSSFGPVLFSILLSAFGILLIVAGVASGYRARKRQGTGPQ